MNSMFQKLGAWFLQESGKKFVFGAAVTAGAGIASINIIPHTFLLQQYRDVVHLYKNGFTVPVSQQINDRFKKTLDLLKIPENDKKQFKPFMVYGFDIFSAGTFFSRFGVIVGIPVNYTYIDDDIIDTHAIQIDEHSVPWELDEGKLLLKSLTLSENAQLYSIAREIQLRKTPKYFIDMFGSIASFLVAYGVGNSLNTKHNFYAKPRLLRFVMYALLGSFAFGNYIFVKDFSQLYYEKEVDEYLKNKNTVFKEGGKEFYSSILNRNIALRKLMGKVGEHNYTALGNENYLIRQRHLPLVQRRSFFEGDVENM